MNTLIHEALVREQVRNGQAEAARRAQISVAHEVCDDVVLRTATRRDRQALRRLAELDSANVPTGPTLVAEHDGMLVAAIPLNGGRAIADPFVASAPFARLLELRAAQLRTAL